MVYCGVYSFLCTFNLFLSAVYCGVYSFLCAVYSLINLTFNIWLKGIFLSEVVVIGMEDTVYADVVRQKFTYQIIQAYAIFLLECKSVGLAMV